MGRKLARSIIAEGRAIGFETIRLDTLPSMSAAIQLYESLGFARCAAYFETRLLDTVFIELQLGGKGSPSR